MTLGIKLRQARVAAGLRISEVAERAGFSTSYVSQVERDVANPSVGALNRIADALGIRMGILFNSQSTDLREGNDTITSTSPDYIPTVVVKHDQRKNLTYPESNIRYDLLTPDVQHNLMVLMSRCPSQTTSGEYTLSHEGEECVVVIQGTVQFVVGEEEYTVGTMDSIRFDGRTPHAWRNAGPDEALVLWVVTPPHF